MWNKSLRSGGGGPLGGGLGKYFVSAYGSKLGVSEVSMGSNLVCLG